MNTLSLPKGTRDFFGERLLRRKFIINTIKEIFELYGFEELETPAMENVATLMGKYGEEGDKLIFRILNNGDIFKNINLQNQKETLENISNKALRYDLTIPFARFISMNYNQLTLPFKRYQIQPVWRGDRPQKGRYREFYQCDADLIGSNALLHEVEFINIYKQVFEKLQIPQTSIHINSRKILLGLIEKINATAVENNILIAIDKIDKIGIDAILEELKTNLNSEQIKLLHFFLTIKGDNLEILHQLKSYFQNIEIAQKGIEEITYTLQNIENNKNYTTIKIDLTLARGLNYYTGLILEAKTTAVKIGSIGGGGRYDNLTNKMGNTDLSGIGISFGIDRIYDVMEELNIFPKSVNKNTQYLFFNMGEKEIKTCLQLANELRKQHISCEIFHEKSKMDKQFKYAEKKNIPYIIIVGENEQTQQILKIKNITSGKEFSLPFAEIKNISQFVD